MLTFLTTVPSQTDYVTAHLRVSLIVGDWVELEYHSVNTASAGFDTAITLPRPFRNASTGVTLRSSRADVGAFAAQFVPCILQCVHRFTATLLPPYASEASMPLFASAGWPANAEDWASFIQTLLPSSPPFPHAGPRPVEVICSHHRWETPDAEAPKLTLPLQIACDADLSDALLDAASYFRDRDVQRYVMRIVPWRNRDLLPEADILILSERTPRARSWLSRDQISNLSVRTRLVIVLDPTPQSPFRLPARFRRETAVAVIPLSEQSVATDALHYFLEELVHDNPLHDAMRLMREHLKGSYTDPPAEQREWTSLARVYADSATNQSLRLSTLVPQVAETAAGLLPASSSGNFANLAARLSQDVAPSTLQSLSAVFTQLDAASQPFRSALQKEVTFDRESNGLVPLAAIAGTTARMTEELARLTPRFAALVSERGVHEALEKHQQRRLDAQLFYRFRASTHGPVSPDYALSPGTPLRLRVHIGQRSQYSVVTNEPPALDPLLPMLPKDEYHELQITVFPKDFELESHATHTVRLSSLGGTAPVEWDLMAPRIVKETPQEFGTGDPVDNTAGLGWIVGSQASLRLNVYFRNQLLQSFKLTALIGDVKPANGSPAIAMECDYSQTRRFGELDEFRSRTISLAMNADGDTHTLMIVKDERGASIRWDTAQLAGFTEAIRQELYEAMAENGASRFMFDPTSLSLLAQTAPNFEWSVRALASAGSRLHDQLFMKTVLDPALKQALMQIKQKDAETIQITAMDPNYAFPWPILYDFDQPPNDAAAANPICPGKLHNGATCNCHENAKTYCLRGFWGLRLTVEQRVPAPEPLLGVPSRVSPSPSKPVIGLVTAVSDEFIKNWAETLQSATGLTVKAFANTESLLHTFRNEAGRPSVIIFVGHHRNAGSDKLPDHQLLSPDNNSVLRLADFKKTGLESWGVPRSLVFLLACSAGTTRADTGPSLATALLGHGAAGVIATECTVFTPMVARMSRDILAALAASSGNAVKTTIGRAMQQTLLGLAREGCPLGLAFTYHGIAEASLP